LSEQTFPSWPAWYYGPDNQSQIFENEDQVPDGWVDSPAKLSDKKPKGDDEGEAAKKREQEATAVYEKKTDAEIHKELNDRKIEFGTKWPRNKLVALLVAADLKKGK
jgi:hypothetical protein